ncbi:alpha/beta fold hydrolase [Robertmurraya sp. Marseille-Q9965]
MPVFNFEETQLYFEDYGTGIPIVFIHPPAMGRRVFHFQFQLSDRYQVIFPDLTGHGDSIAPYRDVFITGYAQEIKGLKSICRFQKRWSVDTHQVDLLL